MAVYYRQTSFQQRKYLFELVEQLGNVSEACRLAKVSRKTYYHQERIKLKKRWGEMSNVERKGFSEEKKRSDGEWERKRAERRDLKAERDKGDEK